MPVIEAERLIASDIPPPLPVKIDLTTGEVFVNGGSAHFIQGRINWGVLKYMVQRPRTILKREEIREVAILSGSNIKETVVVGSTIGGLRKSLGSVGRQLILNLGTIRRPAYFFNAAEVKIVGAETPGAIKNVGRLDPTLRFEIPLPFESGVFTTYGERQAKCVQRLIGTNIKAPATREELARLIYNLPYDEVIIPFAGILEQVRGHLRLFGLQITTIKAPTGDYKGEVGYYLEKIPKYGLKFPQLDQVDFSPYQKKALSILVDYSLNNPLSSGKGAEYVFGEDTRENRIKFSDLIKKLKRRLVKTDLMVAHAVKPTTGKEASFYLKLTEEAEIAQKTEQIQIQRQEEFMKTYVEIEGRLLRYIRRMVGYDDAEDILQEVARKGWQASADWEWNSSKSLTPDQGRISWLFRIAHNEIVNYKRHKGLRPTLSIDNESFTGRSIQVPDKGPFADPVNRSETSERIEVLREALSQLPEKQKTILILRFQDGLDYREIADKMGLNINTVKITIHRGRLKLRELAGKDDNNF